MATKVSLDFTQQGHEVRLVRLDLRDYQVKMVDGIVELKVPVSEGPLFDQKYVSQLQAQFGVRPAERMLDELGSEFEKMLLSKLLADASY